MAFNKHKVNSLKFQWIFVGITILMFAFFATISKLFACLFARSYRNCSIIKGVKNEDNNYNNIFYYWYLFLSIT